MLFSTLLSLSVYTFHFSTLKSLAFLSHSLCSSTEPTSEGVGTSEWLERVVASLPSLSTLVVLNKTDLLGGEQRSLLERRLSSETVSERGDDPIQLARDRGRHYAVSQGGAFNANRCIETFCVSLNKVFLSFVFLLAFITTRAMLNYDAYPCVKLRVKVRHFCCCRVWI